MDAYDIAASIGAEVLTPECRPGAAIERVATGDHISRLLNEAAPRTILVTRLAGAPLIRVAELMEAPAVCLVDAGRPSAELAADAAGRGIVTMVSPWPVEETCRRIRKILDAGRQRIQVTS